jgi:hypothetical protein
VFPSSGPRCIYETEKNVDGSGDTCKGRGDREIFYFESSQTVSKCLSGESTSLRSEENKAAGSQRGRLEITNPQLSNDDFKEKEKLATAADGGLTPGRKAALPDFRDLSKTC